MEIKKRKMPKELQIFNSLSPRFELTKQDKQNHYNLRKGYEGELMFDHILHNQLQCEYLIIKDLLLNLNSNLFQIDTLIIFPSVIEIYEIKNFEGEYFYDSERDKVYKNKDFEIQNPKHQLSRVENLFLKLLHRHGLHANLQGTVVFVNPEFTLYNHTPDEPFILSSQINSRMQMLNQNSTRIITKQDKALGEKILSLHEENPPLKNIPIYNLNELKKGITCHNCNSLATSIRGHYCYCTECGEKELVKKTVIRSANDFKLLFPNKKITKANIFEWCGGMVSEQRIKRILRQNFQLIDKRKWSYYEFDTNNENEVPFSEELIRM